MAKNAEAPTVDGGGPLEPEAAVILYDRHSGTIFATHYFSAAGGAGLPDREELERVARNQAAGDGCDLETHEILHVEPAALRHGVAFRVDKGALVPIRPEGAPEPLSAGRQPSAR